MQPSPKTVEAASTLNTLKAPRVSVAVVEHPGASARKRSASEMRDGDSAEHPMAPPAPAVRTEAPATSVEEEKKPNALETTLPVRTRIRVERALNIVVAAAKHDLLVRLFAEHPKNVADEVARISGVEQSEAFSFALNALIHQEVMSAETDVSHHLGMAGCPTSTSSPYSISHSVASRLANGK